MTTTILLDRQNNPVDYETALAEYKIAYELLQAELASYDTYSVDYELREADRIALEQYKSDYELAYSMNATTTNER
jgi:hypothetical protein